MSTSDRPAKKTADEYAEIIAGLGVAMLPPGYIVTVVVDEAKPDGEGRVACQTNIALRPGKTLPDLLRHFADQFEKHPLPYSGRQTTKESS